LIYTNFSSNATNRENTHNASAKAIAKIIVDLISPAAEGFLPIQVSAAKPIRPIPRAGPNTHNQIARAIAISFIKIINLKNKIELRVKN